MQKLRTARLFALLVTMLSLAVAGCGDDNKNTPKDGGSDAQVDGDGDVATPDGGDADGGDTDDGGILPVAHPKVLLLNDHDPVDIEGLDAAPAIVAALEAADVEVTNGGYFPLWDGTNPAVTGFDVVIWLQGDNYAEDVLTGLPVALHDFVTGGGVLVRTEWGGYNLGSNDTYAGIDDLFPVTYNDGYAYVSTWNAASGMGSHPYLAGVTLPWETVSGHSNVTAVDGATVIAELTDTEETPATWPAITEKAFDDGKVVHINHDVLYTTETVDVPFAQILVNIANDSVAAH